MKHFLPSVAVTAVLGVAHAEPPVIVPLELHNHSSIVVATIEGQDVPLVFDLGDQTAVKLDQSVLDRIKAVPTGRSTKEVGLKGHVIDIPTYTVPLMRIGTAEFRNVIAQLSKYDPAYTPRKIGDQGALGTGLFKSYEVVLNYPNRTLTLVQRADGTPTSQRCQGSPVPFSPEWHGEAVTTIDTDLGQLTVWWDTGTTTSVLSKRFVQRARPNLTKDALTTQRLMIGTRNFGPMKFEIWEMALPPGFDGFMGYSFFARHVVCIDYPDKQVLIR